MADEMRDLMIVADEMRDLMEALAHGHAALVDRSDSPLGRLAVKTADLTLDFDLSAEAKKVGDSFRLQVRPTPFFGFTTSTTTEKSTRQLQMRNHAQLVLHIVNVPPAPDPADQPDDAGDSDDDNSGRETDAEKRRKLIDAIVQIQQFIDRSPGMKVAFNTRELSRINQGFEAAKDELAPDGSEARAMQNITPFYSELRTAIMAQDDVRSIKPSLARLDAWLNWQPAANADWRERLALPLTNLRQLVGDLPVPPAVKGQFTRRAKQVLASANENVILHAHPAKNSYHHSLRSRGFSRLSTALVPTQVSTPRKS